MKPRVKPRVKPRAKPRANLERLDEHAGTNDPSPTAPLRRPVRCNRPLQVNCFGLPVRHDPAWNAPIGTLQEEFFARIANGLPTARERSESGPINPKGLRRPLHSEPKWMAPEERRDQSWRRAGALFTRVLHLLEDAGSAAAPRTAPTPWKEPHQIARFRWPTAHVGLRSPPSLFPSLFPSVTPFPTPERVHIGSFCPPWPSDRA